MLALKVFLLLSTGAIVGLLIAGLMFDSSEQSRKEEKLLREEMLSNRKYEEHND